MTQAPLVAWRLDQAHVAVPIDLRLYTLDAAMRAAYKFTDRAFVLLERNDADANELFAYFVGRSTSVDLTAVAMEFANELLDQQLRCRLEEQFRDVRTLIVAQAFSEGNLIDPDAEDGDYLRDPHGAGRKR